MEYFQGHHEYGSSRYIKKYENAVGFGLDLACAEGWRLGIHEIWRRKETVEDTHCLRDFLKWLWKETILDLNEAGAPVIASEPKVQF
jgi:hypothetical protein